MSEKETPTVKLTAQQIHELDEFMSDEAGYRVTLRVALNYHSNHTNELEKRRKAWWDDLIKTHGLDPDKVWGVSKTSCRLVVKEIKEKE